MKFATAGLLIMLISLTACARLGISNEKQLAVVSADVVDYSPAMQAAAALEVEAGGCPILVDFIKDYCVMRDQSRTSQGKLPTCTIKKRPR